MKTCSACGESKELEEFPPFRHGQLSKCRSCRQKYDREYHARRSAVSKERKLALQVQRKREIAEEITAYKSNHPCIDCGESDPIVLDFDHVKDHKIMAIADLIRYGFSRAKILAEIEKCEVRCANCHRRVTHKRRQLLQSVA